MNRQFIGGGVYTNKLGFYKVFPWINENSDQIVNTLWNFIKIVRLPYSLHSDNHGNFKEGLFNHILQKFGI